MLIDIPTRAFFQFAATCSRLEKSPAVDGSLEDWSDEFRLPELAVLDRSREPFASVYAGWREEGLYFGVHVTKPAAAEVKPDRPLRSDGLQLWVDTRDVRDAHRASRYCHHFFFHPGKGSRKARGGQVRIRGARAQSSPCEPSELTVASRANQRGYRMEVQVPAHVLHGFDPEENRRLGFTYLVVDRKLGRQYWTADDPLPVSYDPSLWGTIELVE